MQLTGFSNLDLHVNSAYIQVDALGHTVAILVRWQLLFLLLFLPMLWTFGRNFRESSPIQ